MFIKKKEFEEIKNSISNVEKIIQASNELQNVHHQQINALVFEKKELKDELKKISIELKEERKKSNSYKAIAGGYASSEKKNRDKYNEEISELKNQLSKTEIECNNEIERLKHDKKELKDLLKISQDSVNKLNKEKNDYKEKNSKLKEEKKEQKKIIDNLNKEIVRLKSKPKTTPTIEELEKDKLFHGKKKGDK